MLWVYLGPVACNQKSCAVDDWLMMSSIAYLQGYIQWCCSATGSFLLCLPVPRLLSSCGAHRPQQIFFHNHFSLYKFRVDYFHKFISFILFLCFCCFLLRLFFKFVHNSCNNLHNVSWKNDFNFNFRTSFIFLHEMFQEFDKKIE